MYRTDYILKLIEQFSHVLIKLRNRLLRREQSSEEALAELHEIAREAGLDLDIARRLDPGMLLAWLAPTDEPNEPRIWLMAELLYLAGVQHPAGTPDLRRSLKLFAHLPAEWRPSDELASAGERITELEELIAGRSVSRGPA